MDDERAAPLGWTRVSTVEETLALLEDNPVEILSLDHDLGQASGPTGYDVLVAIEEWVVRWAYEPPALQVHSANPAGRRRMELAIGSIHRLVERNRREGRRYHRENFDSIDLYRALTEFRT